MYYHSGNLSSLLTLSTFSPFSAAVVYITIYLPHMQHVLLLVITIIAPFISPCRGSLNSTRPFSVPDTQGDNLYIAVVR